MHERKQRQVWYSTTLVGLSLGLLVALPAIAVEEAENAWPREIETVGGLVVMYQPQIDSLEGDILKGRAAVMIKPKDGGEPVFGAVWTETRITTDLDGREVLFEDIRVPRVRFPDATPEQEQRLIDLLTREIPTWDLDLSLDRLIALLDLAEVQTRAAEGLDNSAPKIIFHQEPSVLITIDGEPQLREAGQEGLKAVVNTPFLLVQDPKDQNLYYLYAGSDTWYKATAVMGPWAVTNKVPKKVRKLEPEDEEVDPEVAAEGPSTPPAIVVTTEPAELIVTEGPPEYKPIAGSELLIVTNSESDILREVASQQIYVLLSGRWFSSKSMEGPWDFVRSDQLPDSFADIDPDGDYGYLLVWVAGTEMANEAVLDASVPQTAAIKRDATIQVSYDGEPKFEPVQETTLYYAVNTESQVIKASTEYYCVEQGVWYVASDAKGPWRVATEVPEEIRTIPASSPVYNTKYVYIYDSTPEVVYVGYYPGYTSSYIYYGVPVYGTGWYYRPYWSPYHYYPRYSTWGFSVRYNPWYGWSFGLSYSTGRFTFSIGYGAGYRGGWWGAGGYRGYHRGYHRGWHHGYRAGTRAGYNAGYRAAKHDTARNMYQRSGNANRVAHTSSRGRTAATTGAMATRTPQTAANRANNVYADKNGNVHRRQQDGSWQQHTNGSWKNSDGAGAAATKPATRPQPEAKPQQRPSSGSYQGSGSMNRDYSARQRGNQRAYSAPRGGGARRGGGGRRR